MLDSLKNQKKKQKIIWAVDSTQDPGDAENIIKELKIWAKHLNCEVQPVSVFSNAALAFQVDLAPPWKEKFKVAAQKSLNNYLKQTKAKGFLTPELLFISTLSSRSMASVLSKYAETKRAMLIFAHTRAMKTWNPFRMGGFAETLAATSRVPVLLLNPSIQPSTKIPSILFPTNFTHESKNAMMKLEPLAKAFNSKVIIYNQVESPSIYLSEVNGIWPAQGISLESMTRDLEKARLKNANKWSELLQKENIENSLLVQRQRKYIGAEIIDVAKKSKTGLIAIASHRGSLAQAFLGGVVRDVILHSKCPVLIFYRPKNVRKHLNNMEQITDQRYFDRKGKTAQLEVQHN